MITDFLNALVLITNFVIIPGLTYGAQLALGALGITIIYSTLRFANFAHGEIMAFGTMMTILFTWGLQSISVTIAPFPTALLAILPAIGVTIGMVLLMDSSVFRFYRKKRSPPAIFVIASIGVMFVINGVIRFIIGPGDRNFADGERYIIKARTFCDITGLDVGLGIKVSQVITVVTVVALVMALFWFLQKTRTGKSMRAYADNIDLAMLSGIRPERVVMISWIITGTLATVAGALYGLDKSFKPFTYFQLLLPLFAAAIVGGIGKPVGAIVGGLVIAFSEVGITYAYKRFLGYLLPEGMAPEGLVQLLSTDYKFAVSFIILVIVLLVRPTGIMKGGTV